MFPSPPLLHLRPIKVTQKRPQSAPGSANGEDRYRLPASHAPILLPAAEPSDPQCSSPRRARPAQKSLSYVASECSLRGLPAEPQEEQPIRKVRKLPPLPLNLESEPSTSRLTPTPSPDMSQYPRPRRPLPTPPTSNTAQGPVPPTLPPRSASLPHFRLSQLGPAPPPRLQTLFTEPPSPGLVFSTASPITPDVAPEDAKTKNFSKLRRFLGESIPPDMVLRPNSRASSMTSESTVSSLDDNDQLVSTPDQRLRDFGKRISRKWVREKHGHRWVEEDYQDVLKSLRKL
ncbi:hypothetical protein OE88DRAFT_135797 [Heliocybe sulcata]|uniref:Uncharacterized protein n=1 Tax=Heliocybe sulcata TaxID=5364 RepID=A0A5C3NJP1_9AGAM|nr:hypothetical protein OE88DRAFT_135797 [Heliocybe sulcata]